VGWRCGSRGRVPAEKIQDPKFKPQYHPKQNKVAPPLHLTLRNMKYKSGNCNTKQTNKQTNKQESNSINSLSILLKTIKS
jgi:hypothetical protein